MCKLVDLTIEPLSHAMGTDLYERSQALATANLLHMAAPTMGNAGAWDAVLRTFNRACAQPTDERFHAFASSVEAWHASADQMLRIADMLLEGSGMLRDSLHIAHQEPLSDPLDPALPLFVLVAASWGEALQGDFGVLHDNSAIIKRWTDVLMTLDDLPDLSRPGRRLDRLRIGQGQLDASGDSRRHARLQVADVIVGAVRTWTTRLVRGQPLDEWSCRLRELTAPWVIDAIWPDPDFMSSVPPSRPEG